MPNTQSAEKRLRSDARRRMENRARKSRIRTSERLLKEAMAKGEKDKLPELLSNCFAQLDKAAKTGCIHRNTADRKKARLTAAAAKVS